MSRESRQRRREAALVGIQGQRGKRLGLVLAFVALILCGVGFALNKHQGRTHKGNVANQTGFKMPNSYPELCGVALSDLSRCDIARMNLLCAEGLRGSEDLNIEDCINKIDGIAGYVKSETERHLYKFKKIPAEFNHSEGYFRMMMMTTVLQQDLGVHYNPDRALASGQPIERNSSFYADSKDVFIHGLAREKGAGTCSSMPVFLVSVGRRLGYPLKLVKAKGHLFVRWDELDRSFNVEATSIGFNSYPDSYYRNWPAPFNPEEELSEGYLKSLTPTQELSVFLSIRGLCLDAAGKYQWALGAFGQAYQKDPESIGNKLLLHRAEKVALGAGVFAGKQAVLVELKHLEIPEGQWRDYFIQHKQILQGAILLGVQTDADIEAEMQRLKASKDRVNSGLTP